MSIFIYQPSTMRVAHKKEVIILGLILLIQISFPLFLLHNSAMSDEALYINAGHQILSHFLEGGDIAQYGYSSYFSGYPHFYPVIAGILDLIGGLELARGFSMICLLLTTICVYSITKKMFTQEVALFAVLLFASHSCVFSLSRIATYDAQCLFILAIAMFLATKVSTKSTGHPLILTVVISALFILAFASKYAAIAFIPSIIIFLFCYTCYWQGWKKAILYNGLLLFSFVFFATLAYLQVGASFLDGVRFTTTNRTPLEPTSPFYILTTRILPLGGLFYLLALLGLILSFAKFSIRKNNKHFFFISTLLALCTAALAPLIYHLYVGEALSIGKHITYSIFFVAPLAGYACKFLLDNAQLYVRNIKYNWLRLCCQFSLFGIIPCFIVLVSIFTANIMNQWPTTDRLMKVISKNVSKGHEAYLAGDDSISRYYTKNLTYPAQWINLYGFNYTDKNQHQLTALPAYIAAIQDGYFTIIELDKKHSNSLFQTIKLSKKYDLLATIPYSTGYDLLASISSYKADKGYFYVWKRKN